MWVTDECKKSFMEMKWKKVYRYIVFKIDEKSKLVTVDKVGSSGESYADLAASLPEDDCRYAVFDFDFVTVDNCRKSKIFFIAWFVSPFHVLYNFNCFALKLLCFCQLILAFRYLFYTGCSIYFLHYISQDSKIRCNLNHSFTERARLNKSNFLASESDRIKRAIIILISY